MNDTTTALSFSIFSNKGVYALLLGSGISRSSGIPTGWDIVLDLIKKLALLENETLHADPAEWYRKKYNEEPDYSNILAKLTYTPSERINLLKQYFELSNQEDEQEPKHPNPTKAHKAIAKLIRLGYFKVVITTNFDRLLETALQQEGIQPVVIRHPNDILGAPPLVHTNFTLIKINGDYLDSRFLNTKEELAQYAKEMQNYLLRIFNEFGLITSGWSAKWDNGLISTIRQSENFRFSSYWTYVGKCEKELVELSNFKKGQTLAVSGADSFFDELSEKVLALEKINSNHPLSADIAVARLKKLIENDQNFIQLHDLILLQREDSLNQIKAISDISLYPNKENLQPQLTNYKSTIEILLPLAINGAYWCRPRHYSLFIDILTRISTPYNFEGSFYEETKNLSYYPSLLLLYGMGISALKTEKFDFLRQILEIKIYKTSYEFSERHYLIHKVNAYLIDSNLMNELLGKKQKTPLSTHLKEELRPYYNTIIADDREYTDLFDVFEYFLALYFIHLINKDSIGAWAPLGEFQWRRFGAYYNNYYLLNDYIKEADSLKDDWTPIQLGMFNSDYNKYSEAKNKLDNYMEKSTIR